MKNLDRIKQSLQKLENKDLVNKGKLTLDFSELNDLLSKSFDAMGEERKELLEKIEQYFKDFKPDNSEALKMVKEIQTAIVGAVKELDELKKKEIKIPEFPKEIDIKEPKWFKTFSDSKILNLLGSTKTAFVASIKAVADIFNTVLETKVQSLRVVLIDPQTGLPYRTRSGGGGSTGQGSIVMDGYADNGDGTATLASAGSKEQLPNVPCRRVLITAHESNSGTIVIGSSTVVGALVGRRGRALFSTQSVELFVRNLNQVYFDGTSSSDKIHYYYEK